MPITPDEQLKIASASTPSVVTAMRRLRVHMDQDRWVGVLNRYATTASTIERIGIDVSATGHLRRWQMGEYIAASAPIHCQDGWTFLGKAIHALLAGNENIARHLGYYAELRGSMSLLACGGVGVFNGQHIAVDVNGDTHWINSGNGRGTHSAAWVYLEEWSRSPSAAALLGKAVRVNGTDIRDWAQAVPGGGTWAPLGEALLLALGLDVKKLAEDRDARNTASYRPTSLRFGGVVDPSDLTDFVAELWSLLEPTTSGFELFDQRLLSYTLAQAHRALTGSEAADSLPGYGALLDAVLTGVGTGAAMAAGLKDRFLAEATTPAPGVLGEAVAHRPLGDERHHLGVLGRAAGLLRLATGATRILMRDAGVDLDAAQFWWEGLGARRGLWPLATTTEELLDEWQYISEALDDVADYVDSVGGVFTLGDLANERPRSLIRIGQLDVVPMWEFSTS